MATLRKTIEHWKDRNKSRSVVSVEFFNKEIKKLDTYMEKLNNDNWKHNLISLYFNISLSGSTLITANNQSHSLYLNLLDITEQLKKAGGIEKDKLVGKYHVGIFDLCTHYDDIYKMLESDMQTVKAALLNSFQIT